MTQQHSLNRQGQTIEIGPRHGYRIEGDHAFINAELQIPPQHRSSGEWALELWATEQPYEEGPLTGLKVAQIALELPTPIGPYVYQVDTRTTACLPLQGRPHAMVLALVQQGAEAETSVRAFANYAQPQTFAAPHFEGTVGYRVAGTEVVLQAAGIVNPRPESNLSGTLSLELWAFPVLASGSANDGLRLAAAALEPVAGQAQLSAIERRAAFSEPPVGDYRLALLLCEWTLAHGYVARDRRDFGMTYERPAPAPEVREPSRVPARPAAAAVAAPARPAERLRLVPAVEPETPAPAKAEAAKAEPAKPEPAKAEPAKAEPAKPAPAKAELAKAEPAKAEPAKPAPAKAELAKAEPAKAEPAKPTPAKLVSIQSGSVEDLAQVKGLNLKIAKEIVKARPFTSVADLIRVPGIGQKMLDRLKESVSL